MALLTNFGVSTLYPVGLHLFVEFFFSGLGVHRLATLFAVITTTTTPASVAVFTSSLVALIASLAISLIAALVAIDLLVAFFLRFAITVVSPQLLKRDLDGAFSTALFLDLLGLVSLLDLEAFAASFASLLIVVA